jgi:hypothetical protein
MGGKKKRSTPGTPVGDKVPGKDGRQIQPCAVTLPCKACGVPFTFVMVTRPAKFCPGCQAVRAEESRLRLRDRSAAKRQAMRDAPPERPRRKIRYAGYDESERHEGE